VLKRPQQYTRASEPPYCKENDINPSLNESMHSDGKSRGGGGKKRERSAPPQDRTPPKEKVGARLENGVFAITVSHSFGFRRSRRMSLCWNVSHFLETQRFVSDLEQYAREVRFSMREK
jgi:hypothetical protein